jgi:hypothetical protein
MLLPWFPCARHGPDDLPALLSRTRALNAHERHRVDPVVLEAALDQRLRDPSLGGAWLLERDRIAIG